MLFWGFQVFRIMFEEIVGTRVFFFATVELLSSMTLIHFITSMCFDGRGWASLHTGFSIDSMF